MEISVVDRQTIRCILTKEEIRDFGMDQRALFSNDERVQEFFREIMHRAEEETGFQKEGEVAVEASFLKDERLSITFSAGENPLLEDLIEETKALRAEVPEPTRHEATKMEHVVFQSCNLWDMVDFCHQIPQLRDAALYHYKKAYYLLMDIGGMEIYDLAVLFHLADEYMKCVCYTPGIVAMIQEHGKCLVKKNAAEHLAGM